MIDETQSRYSYSAKSRVIYSRGMQKKKASKSQAREQGIGPYTGQSDRMSTLSKQNVARFNEDYREAKETAARS